MGLFKKKQKQTPQARDLEKAVELGNTDAMGILGDLSSQAGNKDAARDWYEQAATLGDEEAEKALAELDASTSGEDGNARVSG